MLVRVRRRGIGEFAEARAVYDRALELEASGRLLDGEGGIGRRAYLNGSDTVADQTRWRAHPFSD